MTNEAILIHETGVPIPMTCANDTGIAKGAWLILANPLTVTTHAANDEAICAGIAAEEKIADDGKTKIAVWREGIFQATGSAASSTGAVLALSGTAQRLKTSDATTLQSKGCAVSLEDCGGNAETFLVELKPGIGGSGGLS
jgi:hypothetical protein